MDKRFNNSLENITWSVMGQQTAHWQAKKVLIAKALIHDLLVLAAQFENLNQQLGGFTAQSCLLLKL